MRIKKNDPLMPSITFSNLITVDGNGHWSFYVDINGRRIHCKISQEAVEDNKCGLNGKQLYNQKRTKIEAIIRCRLNCNPNIDEIKFGSEDLK
jgi:hypothetical protein